MLFISGNDHFSLLIVQVINLRGILDFSLIPKFHIIFICKSYWIYPLNISRIKLLFIIITILISYLDYCKSFLSAHCASDMYLVEYSQLSGQIEPVKTFRSCPSSALSSQNKIRHNLVPSTLLISSLATSCLLVCSSQTGLLTVLKHVKHAPSLPLHSSLLLEYSSPRHLHISHIHFFLERPFLTNQHKQ